jgi:hypothetical protein
MLEQQVTCWVTQQCCAHTVSAASAFTGAKIETMTLDTGSHVASTATVTVRICHAIMMDHRGTLLTLLTVLQLPAWSMQQFAAASLRLFL